MRKIEEINIDYQKLCLKSGHIQYQIYALGFDLELVNKELRELNLEAAKAQSEAEAKKAE